MTDRIERSVVLPVSPARAWRELTDPDRLAEWLADEVDIDLRPGGDARFRFGEQVRDGWFEQVVPRERLAFWWAEPDEPASRVEITLTPERDGTRVSVVECRPLELLDLVGIPLPGSGGATYGPALVAA